MVVGNQTYVYRQGTEKIDIMSKAPNDHRKFVMDVVCNDSQMHSITLNHRYNNNVIIRRLCMSNHKHRNPKKIPDDMPDELKLLLTPYKNKKLPCPHIHILQNSPWGDWAIPAYIGIGNTNNSTVNDVINNMKLFFKYCNIDWGHNIINIYDGSYIGVEW